LAKGERDSDALRTTLDISLGHSGGQMVRRLVVFLALSSFLGLVAACGGDPTPRPTSTPFQRPTVAFEPESVRVAVEEEIGVDLMVYPADKGVSAAEIRLEFDPAVLDLLSASPGTFLGNDPLVIASTIDNETGSAYFVMGRKGSTEVPSQAGELLTLRWKTRLGASPGSYPVRITLSQLTNESFDFITVVDSRPLTFEIQ